MEQMQSLAPLARTAGYLANQWPWPQAEAAVVEAD
jgi:hypothetical protein